METADTRPVVMVLALALVVGYVASRIVDPVYQARATLWVEKGNAAAQILTPQVVDSAVHRHALYLEPRPASDLALFTGFGIKSRFMPGNYTLSVDPAGKQWTLSVEDMYVADSGAVGDSLGARMGLTWLPAAAVLARHAGREVAFTVHTPRQTGRDLRLGLTAAQPVNSRFLSLSLMDEDPRRAAVALNAIAGRLAEVTNARGLGPVTVLDSAVAPLGPARNSTAQVIGIALVAGVGIGLCLLLVQIVRRAGTLAVPSGSTD